MLKATNAGYTHRYMELPHPLYICGSNQEHTHELRRYCWDIIGLSEVRRTGIDGTSTKDGCKIWFSGE